MPQFAALVRLSACVWVFFDSWNVAGCGLSTMMGGYAMSVDGAR